MIFVILCIKIATLTIYNQKYPYWIKMIAVGAFAAMMLILTFRMAEKIKVIHEIKKN